MTEEQMKHMRKIVHLYKRRPDLSVDTFHANLLAAAKADPDIPGLVQFGQSHTLVQGYRKGELLFDGVEEFSFASAEAAADFRDSVLHGHVLGNRKTDIDEAASHVMVVDVHRVKDTPVPDGAVKNIEFVNRRAGMPLDDFRHYWRDIHGPIGSRISSILRYEQNHTALCAYEKGASPRFDGLAITWFESTRAMRDGADTPEYEVTRADEANFLPDGHLPIIITREVLTS